MGEQVEDTKEKPAAVDDVDSWYTRKYAQLSAEAFGKYISNKSLSGKEDLADQVITVGTETIQASKEPQAVRFVKTQRLPAELEMRSSVMQVPGHAYLSFEGSQDLLAAMAHQQALRHEAGSTRGRSALLGMNAWERHKHFVANYVKYYGGHPPPDTNQTVKTDWDVLRESYRFDDPANTRFIRHEGDDAAGGWEVELAQKYYRKLFKEYAVGDLSRYKEGKLGLRWRTEKEVVSGKGQFVCGAKGCHERGGLASLEVNFVFEEAGIAKAALVKLRLCPKHALHLNYQRNKLALQTQKTNQKRAGKSDGSKKSHKQDKKRRRSDSPHTHSGEPSAAAGADKPSPTRDAGVKSTGNRKRTGDAAVRNSGSGPDDDAAAVFRDMFD